MDTKQIHWRAKQPLQVDCFYEHLSDEEFETMPAEDITPLITWRRGAWKKEASDNLPRKDEKGPLSIR